MPSFFQAVTNFVMYKFGSLNQADWQMMYDLAKMFLYCFNHWKLETPSVHARSTPSDNQRNYKENYSRYVSLLLYQQVMKNKTSHEYVWV